MKTLLIYGLAAFAEIAGCFSFWAWLKLHKSPLWIAPGILALILFAYLLTLVDSPAAGRTYAAYGAIYIASSLIWLWLAEHQRPDRWDMAGLALCQIGSAVILFGARTDCNGFFLNWCGLFNGEGLSVRPKTSAGLKSNFWDAAHEWRSFG